MPWRKSPASARRVLIFRLGSLGDTVVALPSFRLIARTGPAKAITVTFMIPLFAVFYGTTFLGEAVTGWMIVCGGVILLGIALATGLWRPLPTARPR